MDETKYLDLFRASYAEVQKFYGKWMSRIQERCNGDPQREAALHAWARYSMSMRTLERLLDPALLPDVYVICRGCLEFDVTLEGVMKDPEIAKQYLEFDKYARAHYLRLVAEFDDPDKYLKLLKEFEEQFENEDIDDLRRTSWHANGRGITGLMRHLGRTVDVRAYAMLCHFAHGSIWAMQTLNGQVKNPPLALAAAIRSTYGGYLGSTCSFVSFIWQPLLTPDGVECKRDIVDITYRHVEEAK